MLSIDNRACRNYRGCDNDKEEWDVDTLTAASKVDASSGRLASDCSALRAEFGMPTLKYECEQ